MKTDMSDDYATPSNVPPPMAETIDPTPSATPALYGREYLESIDARCLSVNEKFCICADVKTLTGAAHARDGLLMPATDVNPAMECWRVLEAPHTTYVCSVDRSTAHIELQKMPDNDALRRAVQGKVDLISVAHPRMGSQGPGTSELIH